MLCLLAFKNLKKKKNLLIGKPFGLQNCSISNQSSDSLQVECIEEGFNGGLPQVFILELIELSDFRLVRNLSVEVMPQTIIWMDNFDRFY